MKSYCFNIVKSRLNALKYEVIDDIACMKGCRKDILVRRIRGTRMVAAAPKDGSPGCLIVRLSRTWYYNRGPVLTFPGQTVRDVAESLRRGVIPAHMRFKYTFEGADALGWRTNL